MSYHFQFFSRNIHYKKTTFLHFYQVICAIPGRLLTKAKTNDFSAEKINNEDRESFHLDENVVINLLRAKSKDFYWLILDKKYKHQQTGAKRWNQTVPMDKTNWTNIFKSVQKTCRENRVREFHFKFIHRIVVTKKELFRFNIKSDSNCIYCGALDSIDHTFSECQFTKSFTQEVLQCLIQRITLKLIQTLKIFFLVFSQVLVLCKKNPPHATLSAVLYL